MEYHKKHKVVHIIIGLDTGGAEVMLYNLLSKMDKNYFEAEVVSLTNVGPVGEKIKSIGIPVRALNMMQYKIPNPLVIFKLAYWLKKSDASVIQTWMYHADLIGSVSVWLAKNIPVVWGIHNTNLDPKGSKRSTIWIAKICAKLSHSLPVRIICCSEASRKVHSALGYNIKKMIVIPNGFDLEKFKPNPGAKLSIRKELGLDSEAVLIGLVARFDPQKDHDNFIRAAARMNRENSNIHFVLCGDDIDKNNKKITELINKLGLDKYIHLLGRRDDMNRIMASLDILSTSSSFGEAFPIVVGEAMACAIPCSVTDVGDSGLIVGDTGKIVPLKDPDALAMAWRDLIEMGKEKRKLLGKAARERIRNNFSIEVIVARYEEQYRELIKKRY